MAIGNKLEEAIWSQYPLHESQSVWGNYNGTDAPLYDIEKLVNTCIRELQSDVQITEHKSSHGMVTRMPEDTLVIKSAMLDWTFQGNKKVKFDYNIGKKEVYMRFYPATITYTRRLRIEDLETLEGDRFIYCVTHILYKMALKELWNIKSVDIKIDNGALDYSILDEFVKDCETRLKEMKPEILMYSSTHC